MGRRASGIFNSGPGYSIAICQCANDGVELDPALSYSYPLMPLADVQLLFSHQKRGSDDFRRDLVKVTYISAPVKSSFHFLVSINPSWLG